MIRIKKEKKKESFYTQKSGLIGVIQKEALGHGILSDTKRATATCYGTHERLWNQYLVHT